MSEDIQVKIEVRERGIVLILPKKMDDLIVHWQQAYMLGDVMEKAVQDNKSPLTLPDPQDQIEKDQNQIKILAWKEEQVVLVFNHTDHVGFCFDAAILVARAIRLIAQNQQYKKQKKIILPNPLRKRFGIKGL